MTFIKKHLYWILLSVILCMVLGFVCLEAETIPTRFCISNEYGSHNITIYDAGDGNCYVFLPSYGDLEHLTVVLPPHHRLSIGGVTLSDGMTCGDFELETPYPFHDNTHQDQTLWFYRSANVATMYINTVSGNMKRVNMDKSVSENSSILVYSVEGTLEHRDDYGTISGRGNSTWNYHKRPYSLKLSQKADLLNMGASTNWILLANAADGSNIMNKIVLDLAKQAGMDYTVQGEYVDLYLNGEYNGLYLLTEKVEVDPERVDLDTDGNDFFANYREVGDDRLSYHINTPAGRTVSINEPDGIGEERMNEITQLIVQLEQELLSGEDLTNAELMDLDSWVCKYIIDEVSANVDADRASVYFYYKDGTFYAGPVWDYDKGFGDCKQSRNPWAFVANNQHRSASYSLPYYPKLYQNPSFRNRVVELYQTKFLPILQEYVNGGIAELGRKLSAANNADRLRWEGLTPDLVSPALIPVDWTSVLDYLTTRVEFLNSAWIEGVDYCTVQFMLPPGNEYVNYAVERGQVLQVSDIDLENTVWYDSQTGEVFDPDIPIEQDLLLVVKQEQQKPPVYQTGPAVATNVYAVIVSVSMLSALLICFVCIEWRRSRTGRRQSDAQRE